MTSLISPAFSPAVVELRRGLRHLLSTEISTAGAAVRVSGGEVHVDAAASRSLHRRLSSQSL